MNALLQAASEALRNNDTHALEELVRECEHLRDQGCFPLLLREDRRTIQASTEILSRQVEAARQHLALRQRLSNSTRKDSSSWERSPR